MQFDAVQNNELIIVNHFDKDEKKEKVVYLSNINSCSAPLTPKDMSEN